MNGIKNSGLCGKWSLLSCFVRTIPIIGIYLTFVLVLAAMPVAHAQWTEPVPMDPQFGPGIRSPWISNDGLRLYLCTIGDVYVVTRDSVNGAWGSLTQLPPHINYTTTQVSACESPGGDTLYFMSDERPEGSYGSYDIFYSVRCDTGWGPVFNCGPNVNGPGREWSVGISRDGSMLLLSSGGPQGLYLELLYCEKQTDGTWGPATYFGPGVNGGSYEKIHPTMAPGNARLFFYVQGPRMGDIWESRKINGVWQEATPLPAPINDQFRTQMDPCIAPDGRTLWYAAERDYDRHNFQIVTSMDTTVLRVGATRPDREPHRQMWLDFQNGNLLIRLDGIQTTSSVYIVVYNLLGREVSAATVPVWRHTTSVSEAWPIGPLSAGIYFVRANVAGLSLVSRFSYIP